MNPLPASAPDRESMVGYYGLPVIHRPHWKWLVIGYFFLGGISGSSAAIGGIAQATGRASNRQIARYAAAVSLAALAPCPILLILDLGRPARFLNMLRAFRVSSPMSVGTWGLTAFGLAITVNVAVIFAGDGRVTAGGGRHLNRMSERLLAAVVIPLGLFVAGYTGVLLAATAVPLWSKRPALLGPLFLSSAVTSGVAAIAVALAALDRDNHDSDVRIQRLEAMSTVVEGTLLAAWIVSLGSTARPLLHGELAPLLRYGIVGAGMVLPLSLAGCASRAPRRWRRAATLVGSLLTIGGVLGLRFVVVEGGRLSADDPRATFEMTG